MASKSIRNILFLLIISKNTLLNIFYLKIKVYLKNTLVTIKITSMNFVMFLS